MSGDGTRTWRELWVEATTLVGDAQHARWLVQEVSGLDGLDWALGLDARARRRSVARLDALVERRRRGEPIQYVLGHWAFRGLDLLVDPRVLIPRPETELVVDAVLEILPMSDAVVVDLGTGSGAIALSIAAERSPGSVEVWGVDVSADALDVARANLVGLSGRHATGVRLAEGSWFAALPTELAGCVDVVVANPPYVGADEMLASDVADWEPRRALVAGPSGLECWSVIVDAAPQWLRPGAWLVGEIGSGQGAALVSMTRDAGYLDVAVRPDGAGLDRVLVARRP